MPAVATVTRHQCLLQTNSQQHAQRETFSRGQKSNSSAEEAALLAAQLLWTRQVCIRRVPSP